MTDDHSKVSTQTVSPARGEEVTLKIAVDGLKPRDRVTMQTSRGSYYLTVGKNHHCILASTNASEKVGQIILRGGTNADVTEYTPNRIFVGGRLAYAFDEETSELITTPVIESMTCAASLSLP